MRSATDLWRGRVAAVVLAVLVIGTAAAAQPASQPSEQAGPDEAAISRALAQVKKDPLLTTERTVKMLKWKDTAAPAPTTTPAWIEWLVGLFRWFDESARILMWTVVAILFALIGVFVTRLVRSRSGNRATTPGFVAPTHVHDLDVRPETLPSDIGAAAQQLWDRGDQRAALALLYRGLLSRLAHVHEVPIRDSTTEGDCLTLAAIHLSPERRHYTSRLVSVWQRVIYGNETASTPVMHALCADFDVAMNHGEPSEGPA